MTKIKQRFEHDPENTYQSFLDILHTFQKKQRSIKDVLDKVCCVTKSLSGIAVPVLIVTFCFQVSELFRDHHDLLKGFTFFLPENVQEEAKVRLQRNISKQNARNNRKAKQRNREKNDYRERKKRARIDDITSGLPEQERRIFRKGIEVFLRCLRSEPTLVLCPCLD